MRIVDLYDYDICYCGSNGEYDMYNIPHDIEPCDDLLQIVNKMQEILTYKNVCNPSEDDEKMKTLTDELKAIICQ